MEINITRFFSEACPKDYSASIAEIGRNAGPDTWQAACDDYDEYCMIDNEEKREEFREYIKGFGAWDAAEIAAMNDIALNALFIQMVAGDVRESGIDVENPNWVDYEKQASEGRISGNLFQAQDGKIYYSLG